MKTKTTARIFKQAAISGSFASVASMAALLHGGVRECRSAFAPVNAVSHWLWEDEAFLQQHGTLRYSVSGYCIHHAASIFWALGYEALLERYKPVPTRMQALAVAGGIAAAACVVDMRCTPDRLTPGFERRLGKPALARVYLAFGLGLALYAVLKAR